MRRVAAAVPRSGNPAAPDLHGRTDETRRPEFHARLTRPKSHRGAGALAARRWKDLPALDPRSPLAAFEAYEEEKQKLASFAFAMTRDRDVADDLVQESYLRLVKELKAGRSPENVSAWLFRVVTNLAMSRGRRLIVAQRFLLRAHSSNDAPSPDLEILRHEENATLLEGLATLRPDAQTALLMAAQGFTGQEIAQMLGRTESATRALMCRARQKLRVYLVHEGVRDEPQVLDMGTRVAAGTR
jgi:RNA polymerase sigma-70 factor, ECF subfamily